MDVVKGPETGDITIKKDKLKVFLNQETNNLLSNATLDFVSDQGFIVMGTPQNPCYSSKG